MQGGIPNGILEHRKNPNRQPGSPGKASHLVNSIVPEFIFWFG